MFDLVRFKRGLANPALIRKYAVYKLLNFYNSIHKAPYFDPPPTYEENLKLIDEEFKEKRIILKSLPTRLTIVVGKECNLKCKMCNYSISNVKDSPSYLENITQEFININSYLNLLYLTGGEPLFYKKSKDFIRLGMHNRHLRFRISTNFNILDNEWIDFIRSGRIDLSISLDAAFQKTYTKIRVGGDIGKVFANVKKINENKHEKTRLNFNYIILKSNYLEIIDFVKLAIDNGADEITFQMLQESNWDPSFFIAERVWDDEELMKAIIDILLKARIICNKNGTKYTSNIDYFLYTQLSEKDLLAINQKVSFTLSSCRSLWDHTLFSWERSNICPWMQPNYLFSNYNIIKIRNSKFSQTARKKFINKKFDNICTSHCTKFSESLDFQNGEAIMSR